MTPLFQEQNLEKFNIDSVCRVGFVNVMSPSNVLFAVCHRNGDVFLLLTAMFFNSPFFSAFFFPGRDWIF